MIENAFSPLSFRGNFWDGRFHPTRRGREFRSEDPGDLSRPVGRFLSDPGAVDAAVDAARRAFPRWRDWPPARRLAYLRRYQKALLRRAGDLAWVISRETGKPWSESRAEVRSMAAKVDLTVRDALPLVADRVFAMDGGARGASRRRPRGVAAVIGPFNVPGHIPNGQLVPALLTGNTAVFKPSELTPFTGQVMAECFQAAGLPPGVFNLVQGGGDVGARLAGHGDADTVFFTGSAATGRRVQELCAGRWNRRVALEMGGKNAALVLPDAPLDWTVKEVIHGAFSTSGQRCSSTSRVLVHRRLAGAFLKAFLEKVDGLTTGYFTEEPVMGPLVRAAAVENFLKAQRTAERLGFETLRRGAALNLSRRGRYVGPSVHLREGPPPGGRDRSYWDEELFAPDVAVYVLGSVEEMVSVNNASQFGLAASVFTASEKAFRRLAPRLEDGVVHWNRTTAMTPGRLPFGGLKASGNHWPAGTHVVYACTDAVGSVEVPMKGVRSGK